MSKLTIGGKTYNAMLDASGEATELVRFDDKHNVSVTLRFDNASDGSVSEDVLHRLKSRYLNNLST